MKLSHTSVDIFNFRTDKTEYSTSPIATRKYRRAIHRKAAYGYDGLSRLDTLSLEQNGSPTASQIFTYDRNGNVLSRTTGGTTVTYSYDAAKKNRLTSTGDGLSYTYDLAGRAITRNGTAITYNYAGTAKSFGSTSYLLDSDGFRVRKVAGTDTLFYVRGIDGSVLAEYGLNGALLTRYIYAGGALVAHVSGGVTSYYIADHLGSTRRIVTPGGSASAYDYWPFGAVYDQGGPGSRYQFTGLERDAESALIHTPARLYDPYAGRFLQGDPLAALVALPRHNLSEQSYHPFRHRRNLPFRGIRDYRRDPRSRTPRRIGAGQAPYRRAHRKALLPAPTCPAG